MKGERKVYKFSELRQIKVPKLPEISIKMVINMVEKDAELRMYYPSDFIKGKKLDREFVFNILNTMHPGYLESIVTYANKLRNTTTKENEAKETILATEEWL